MMSSLIKTSSLIALFFVFLDSPVEHTSYGAVRTKKYDLPEFKKAYHQNIDHIVSRYNRFVADCTFKHNIVEMKDIDSLFNRSEQDGEKPLFQRRFLYKMNDSQMQILIQYIFDHRRNSAVDSTTVFNVAKDYRFKLEKKGSGSFSLKEFGPNIVFEKDLEESYLDPIHFPYKIYNVEIDGLLNDPSFVLKSCEGILYEKKDCVKIAFELNPPKNKVLKSGYFIMSPDDGWIVLRTVCDLKLPNGKILPRSYDCKIDYTFNGNKYPPIKKVDVAWLRYRKIYDFEKYSQIDVPDSEFKLSAFNLPEIGVQAESINRYGPLVLFFIIGAMLVFVGFVVFYLARKSIRSVKTA